MDGINYMYANANTTFKIATIYRKGAFDYSYVCYCRCSFTNISDALEHIESHFNGKGEVLRDDIKFSEVISDTIANTIESPLFESGIKLFKDEVNSQKEVTTTTIQCMESNDDLNCKLFSCEICDHSYDSEDDLNQHMKEHNETYRCKLCYHVCSTPSRLLTHSMEVHLNATKLSCSLCSENFLNKTTFEKHLLNHIEAKDISCNSLIQELISECEICVKLEVEECAPNSYDANLLKCDICSMTFNTKSKLNLHMKQKHMSVPVDQRKVIKKGLYMCDKCNRKIEGKLLFYAHQYEHLTGGNDLNSTDDIALLDNLKIFLRENIQYDESTPATFGCKICCHLSVKRRKIIETHILQEHVYRLKRRTRTEKRYPCEYCGQKFTLAHNMVVHKRIHTNEKPFTCLICNKSFSQSNYMKYHERVHSGLRPHQCSTCGLSFKSNNKLNMHIKIHSTETTKCPICNKEFKPHRLNVHIRHVHQNEHRPYKCLVCSQQFKTSKTLKTHSYRHTGEKKYECRFQCNERFTSTAGRRGHERSKHETT